MTNPAELAGQLAEALDADDYVSAAATMAPEVVYRIGEETLIGPAEVVDSYRAASEMAHRLFDEVRYTHDVVPIDSTNFRILYGDILSVNGETLEHRAEQIVTVEDGRGVIAIQDAPVPGEKERVDAFLARHGLSRDG